MIAHTREPPRESRRADDAYLFERLRWRSSDLDRYEPGSHVDWVACHARTTYHSGGKMSRMNFLKRQGTRTLKPFTSLCVGGFFGVLVNRNSVICRSSMTMAMTLSRLGQQAGANSSVAVLAEYVRRCLCSPAGETDRSRRRGCRHGAGAATVEQRAFSSRRIFGTSAVLSPALSFSDSSWPAAATGFLSFILRARGESTQLASREYEMADAPAPSSTYDCGQTPRCFRQQIVRSSAARMVPSGGWNRRDWSRRAPIRASYEGTAVGVQAVAQ